MLKKYYYVDCIKAFACILIIYFHSDILFPQWIRKISFGGDIGNNLFFMCSGYLLSKSIYRNKQSAIKWIFFHLFQIIPMWWFAAILSVVCGFYEVSSINDIVGAFIFPGMFWFVSALALFYPIFYLLHKAPISLLVYVILSLFIAHLLFDGIVAERYFVGLSAMIVGDILNRKEETRKPFDKRIGICFCVASFALYVLLHFVGKPSINQIRIILHVLTGMSTVLIALFLMLTGFESECYIKTLLEKRKLVGRIIKLLSSITLASYIVQCFGERLVFKICADRISFPSSLVIAYVVILVMAYIITTADKNTKRLIKHYLFSRRKGCQKNEEEKADNLDICHE